MGAGSHAQVLWSTGHGSRYQVIRVKKWSASFLRSPPEPSRVCSYPPHRTSFSPSAPSSFPSIQNSGSHRSGPASVRSMAAGSRGKFHGAGVAGGPGVRRSCEQIRGGRKPGGRGGGDVGGGGSRLEVGASAASLSSPPLAWWQAGPSPPPPPRQQVARGQPVAGRDPPPCAAAAGACLRLPAALAVNASARPLAPQRTTAGPPTPALRGAAAGWPLLPPLCGALVARPLPLPSMAWRGGECAVLNALAGRREEPVAGEPRPREVVVGGGRPVGGSARPLLPLQWPFVAGWTTEMLHDDVAQ